MLAKYDIPKRTVNGRKEYLPGMTKVAKASMLEEIEEEREEFGFTLWISSQQGWVRGKDISCIAGGVEPLDQCLIFPCGPLAMMSDLTHELMERGVKGFNIVYEDFHFQGITAVSQPSTYCST